MGLLDVLMGAIGPGAGSGSGAGMGARPGGPGQADLLRVILGMLAGGGARGSGNAGGLGGGLGGMLGSALGGGAAGGAGMGNMGGAGAGAGGLGGLGGLVEAFTRGGLGDVANSWVGRGENLPVSPDQLGQVFGADRIGAMASQLGIDPNDLLGRLSNTLPQVVDTLTPEGRIPQGDLAGMLGADDLDAMLGGASRR